MCYIQSITVVIKCQDSSKFKKNKPVPNLTNTELIATAITRVKTLNFVLNFSNSKIPCDHYTCITTVAQN